MSGWNIFYGLINFAILAGALFLIGRKMVKGIFGRHRDEVARGLEQSEKAAETARELGIDFIVTITEITKIIITSTTN